jgi:hypothetical protein
MPKSRTPRLPLLMVAAVLLFIAVGTLVPVEIRQFLASPFPGRWHADVIGHAASFAALTFLLVTTGLRARKVLLLAVALAVGTESAQFFVPGRTPLVSDVLVDVSGAAVGLSFAWLRSLRSRRMAAAVRP